ncbi:hypothetical protein ACP275_12G175600 [Erythranthe tilingii]
MSRRVSFSPEAASMNMYSKHGGPTKVGGGGGGNNKIWIFKLPKGSSRVVGGFLRQIGAKVAKAAMPLMSSNRRRRSCSTKVAVSSSAATTTFARSRSYAAETLDSQRAQAIEDCIQFFNSSSSSSFSLQRSDSVTSSC